MTSFNLEESRNRLRLLESVVVHANDAILITNAEPILEPGPVIIYANEAFTRMTGYSMEEILGKTPRILQGPKSERQTLNRIRESLLNWQSVVAEVLNYRKDGSEFWVELSIVPVADEKGWYTHWVSIQRDITERKSMEESLLKSERLAAIGQLAASVAHEIRNPLTTIKGFFNLLQEGFSPKEDFYQVIQSDINRIEFIVNEFLTMAKPAKIDYHSCVLAKLIEDVIAFLMNKANRNHVQIISEIKEEILIYCEETQMKQVFIFLIHNAIEAMPGGGMIHIHASSDQHQVHIQIVDDGIAIESKRLNSLEEPFYTTNERGTGLAFMMSRRILDAHSGSLAVESNVDIGTTIHVSIPKHLSVPSLLI